MSYVDLGILLNLVVGVDGYEVGRFFEAIYEEVHAYIVSLVTVQMPIVTFTQEYSRVSNPHGTSNSIISIE
jgi:hypothetical protein